MSKLGKNINNEHNNPDITITKLLTIIYNSIKAKNYD